MHKVRNMPKIRNELAKRAPTLQAKLMALPTAGLIKI